MTTTPALITGAARRIGARIAHELARRGHPLHLHAHTNQRLLADLADQVRTRYGVQVTTHLADLSDAAATTDLIDRLTDDVHPPTLIINNASEFLGTYPLRQSTDIELLARTLMVNTAVPIALAGMVAQAEEAHVINITDAHTDLTCSRHLPYDVSKAALADATRRLAMLLAPRVRVNAVAPALILPPPGATDDELYVLAERAPLRRPSAMDDVAAAVGFLIDTPSITGQSIMIDSGAHLVWDSESPSRSASLPTAALHAA